MLPIYSLSVAVWCGQLPDTDLNSYVHEIEMLLKSPFSIYMVKYTKKSFFYGFFWVALRQITNLFTRNFIKLSGASDIAKEEICMELRRTRSTL